MRRGKRVLGAGCWVLGLLLVTCPLSLVTDLHAQVPIINASGNCTAGQIPVKADGGWECQTPSGSGIPPGSPGQIPISDGATYLPGDPIVSGPAAEAASPVNNPVWFAGKDGANLIRSIILLAAAPAGTEYGILTRNIPSGTQPVSGTFWQATQPVSGSVSVSNFPASQAVTGTFYQATQPVSLATAPTTPVTGTFWQATQPVSGAFYQATQPVSLATAPTTPVTGTFWQATQPVSGAFYQATQPVSLATAPTTPVTGTFWQATQPVSLASMPSTPVTGTFWQATQPVSGSFYQATQPVSLATAPTTPVTGTFWQTTQPVSLATAPTTPVTGTFWQATQPVSLATAPTTPVTGTFWQATQPVSGTVTATWTGGNGCINPLATLASISVNTSGTSSVQMVAASGSTKVHICALNVVGVSGTTPTFSLVYGTGSNCGTGQAVLLVAFATTAGVLFPFNGPVAVTPASQAVCYLDTGTTPIQRVTMSYVQQ